MLSIASLGKRLLGGNYVMVKRSTAQQAAAGGEPARQGVRSFLRQRDENAAAVMRVGPPLDKPAISRLRCGKFADRAGVPSGHSDNSAPSRAI